MESSKPAPRAASYARISQTVEHRDKVAHQHLDNKALAARRGYVVVVEYSDDGISALGEKERPGFNRMLDDASRGKFDVILATEEARLARNVAEKAELQAVCAEAGIVWETERDGFTDPSTDAGELTSTLRAAMDRMESRRKASRQRSANARRAAEGKPNPGRRRYGYELDGKTPRESEAAVVRRIFEHLSVGGSVRSIALALESEGVDPATANRWHPLRIREIANNPHYGGAMRYKGEVFPSDIIVPIVTPELAADVRALLADASRRTSRGSQPKHLLSNIVHCGTCGERMVYMRAYICRSAKRGHAVIKRDTLDAYVRRDIAMAFLTGGDAWLAQGDRARLSDIVARLARNDSSVLATISDRDEGLVTPKVATARLRELREERLALEATADQVRASSGALAVLAATARELLGDTAGASMPMREALGLADSIARKFAALDIEQQRIAVRALVDVEVFPFYVLDEDGRKRRSSGPRIVLWHKVATQLNPDFSMERDAAADAADYQ